MAYEQIATDVADRILTITLNRPERLNAWTATMCRELMAAFDEADADDGIGAVIVTGAGRGFCAGADLAGGGDTFNWRERAQAGAPPRDNGGEFTLRVFACTKPVIAAINGPAVGVGATMTLPMDVRLASEQARMGFVFARRGIIPEACSSWFLPRVVGISRAMEWVASGRVFSAQEALEGGLVRSRRPLGSATHTAGSSCTSESTSANRSPRCSTRSRSSAGVKARRSGSPSSRAVPTSSHSSGVEDPGRSVARSE